MAKKDSNIVLRDQYNRNLNYLRLSVTDRCNLKCRYCMPSNPIQIPIEQMLTLEEMCHLVRIGSELGITKVRLTGGEPLVRKDIVALVRRLSKIEQIMDISITTNGTLLGKYASSLKAAGLTRVNISLDTLDGEKFRWLTGVNLYESVMDGILTALKFGFSPIKINTVVMNGYNDDEIVLLARLAMRYPFHIRFIEYMPIGIESHTNVGYYLAIEEVKKNIETHVGELIPIRSKASDGPAQRFRIVGGRGEIGLIGSMSSHFCGTCNRIRLTAAGMLRPCLLSDEQVDIINPLRKGASDEELKKIFVHATKLKKREHRLSLNCTKTLNSQMVSIGG